MKRKILYITNYDISIPLSGAPLRSGEIVKFLSRKYELHLINIEGSGHAPGRVEEKYCLRYLSALNSIASRTAVKFSRFDFFIFSHSLFRAAKILISKFKFDMIFCDYSTTATYGYLLSKIFNIPWIYSSHNVEYLRFYNFAAYDFKRYFVVPFYYIVERMGCKADLLIAISENDARVFKKWTDKNKLLVIPQGFDEKIYHPYYEQPSTQTPIVLFHGNYNHLPNKQAVYLTYKKILPYFMDRLPQTIFQFVGASPPKDLSHANMVFTGFVDNLVEHIRKATVVIAPIIQGGGMRSKIIESLACGKVVISTPKGAEGITNAYRNLIITDVERFPEKIYQVIKQSRFKDDVDFKNLKIKFSWNNLLYELDRKIEQIVFRGKAS